MTYDEWLLLKANFGEEKEYLGDGYYRLRQKADGQYELAYLKPDMCGTTTVNPQITLEIVGELVKPVALMDLFETPIQSISYSEETAERLEQELTELVAKFMAAKELT